MKSKLVFLFLVGFLVSAEMMAQQNGNTQPAPAPPVAGARPRPPNDPHKESSSFIGDPESLDPMQVKKESLKEDEEPVLEDIRQVLDEPEKKPEAPAASQSDNPPPPEIINPGQPANAEAPKPAEPVKKAAKPKKKKVTQLPPKKVKVNKPVVVHKPKVIEPKPDRALHSDEPDYLLEKKFNNIYNTFNAQPTSVEAWSSVLGDRKSEVYVVQKGDTLWSISKTLFGDPLFWPKIWSLNRMGIVNPHFITPGLQVVFYSGSDEHIPSLAVHKKKETQEGSAAKASDGSGVSASSGDGAEFDEDVESSLTTLDESVPAGVIPPSLPLSRNDNYFLPGKSLKVDIQNDVEAPEILESDILLTNNSIKSEIDLPLEELVKGRCGGNHVIKPKANQTLESDYAIYELLETLKTDAGPVHAYRYVGESKVLAPEKMKVTSCKTVMSDALVFIAPKNIAGLRANKVSKATQPEILGGPNLGTQSLFSNKQLIYINLGQQDAKIGDTVFVRSQLTDENSGEIKLLDKFGSFAVGILMEVNDLIEKGDMVQLQR